MGRSEADIRTERLSKSKYHVPHSEIKIYQSEYYGGEPDGFKTYRKSLVSPTGVPRPIVIHSENQHEDSCCEALTQSSSVQRCGKARPPKLCDRKQDDISFLWCSSIGRHMRSHMAHGRFKCKVSKDHRVIHPGQGLS